MADPGPGPDPTAGPWQDVAPRRVPKVANGIRSAVAALSPTAADEDTAQQESGSGGLSGVRSAQVPMGAQGSGDLSGIRTSQDPLPTGSGIHSALETGSSGSGIPSAPISLSLMGNPRPDPKELEPVTPNKGDLDARTFSDFSFVHAFMS